MFEQICNQQKPTENSWKKLSPIFSFYVGLQFLDSVVISEVCETGCDKDYCA